MARISKIARLPPRLREEVNRRLFNSEAAQSIAAWLNALPEVQSLLAREFQGKPVSDLNIYHWRDGGFRFWEIQQETLDAIEKLRSESAALGAADARPDTTSLSVCLTARLAVAVQNMDRDAPDHATQSKRLSRLLAELSVLRRLDRQGEQLKIARGKIALEMRKLDDRMARFQRKNEAIEEPEPLT